MEFQKYQQPLTTKPLITDITINKIPSAYLYLQITSSNKNPKVNEAFTLTYKLGNNGPDNATNVTMTIPLPSGFILSNIAGDGSWTINKTTNTITWTLTNVTVGDPYLVHYRKTKQRWSICIWFKHHIRNLQPKHTRSNTDHNSINKPNQSNQSYKSSQSNKTYNPKPTILNTDTTKIPMQHTGLPITGLILAVLSVLGGSIMSRKK